MPFENEKYNTKVFKARAKFQNNKNLKKSRFCLSIIISRLHPDLT